MGEQVLGVSRAANDTPLTSMLVFFLSLGVGGCWRIQTETGPKGPKVLTADMNAAQNATLALHNVRLEACLLKTCDHVTCWLQSNLMSPQLHSCLLWKILCNVGLEKLLRKPLWSWNFFWSLSVWLDYSNTFDFIFYRRHCINIRAPPQQNWLSFKLAKQQDLRLRNEECCSAVSESHCKKRKIN